MVGWVEFVGVLVVAELVFVNVDIVCDCDMRSRPFERRSEVPLVHEFDVLYVFDDFLVVCPDIGGVAVDSEREEVRFVEVEQRVRKQRRERFLRC